MLSYKTMSDISQYIPTGSLQNIATRGQNRLDSAKAVVQDKIAKNNMVKGIEASLGGLKTVTFGKDVFNATAKAIGNKLKNQAAVKAQGGSRTAAKTEEVEPEEAAETNTGMTFSEQGASGVTTGAGDLPGAADTTDVFGGQVASAGGANAPADVAAAARAAPKPAIDPDSPPLPTAAKPVEVAGEPEVAAVGEAGGVGEVGAVAETGLVEGLGGILDATGIGAPLGLALGFVGLGLAAHKDKAVNLVSPDNRGAGGYSYQAGI